jgi:beta-glucanase (GH16 family)
MRSSRATLLSFWCAALFVFVCCCHDAASAGSVFTDNFESGDASSWSLFEEIVTDCYGAGIGEIYAEDVAALEGNYGFTLWSNSNMSLLSNHIIAGRNVSNGASGRCTYELHAMLPSAYEYSSQVGPEWSIQNTRNVAGTGTTTTSIAGIQHIASQYISDKWNIWVQSGANTATWQVLPSSVWDVEPTMDGGTWFKCVLEVDFDINEYVSMSMQEAAYGATVHLANLTGIKIAPELRGFEQATVLTLEAENLYNNCGTASPFESKMYYDKVRFEENVDISGTFELEWEYEFHRHHNDYSDHDVVSWDFNIFSGNFGSSNNAYFMKDNTVVENEQLLLVVTNVSSGGREYSAAGVSSWPAHAQVYGKWEVEAQFPTGFGVTGYIGLFLASKEWPPEVDFAEIIGRKPESLFLTQHYGTPASPEQIGIEHDIGGGAADAAWSDEFHVYTVEWIPGIISYLVDGVTVLEQSVEFNETNALMDISIGFATGDCGGFVDCPEDAEANGFDSTLPALMIVNYVKVYSYVEPEVVDAGTIEFDSTVAYYESGEGYFDAPVAQAAACEAMARACNVDPSACTFIVYSSTPPQYTQAPVRSPTTSPVSNANRKLLTNVYVTTQISTSLSALGYTADEIGVAFLELSAEITDSISSGAFLGLFQTYAAANSLTVPASFDLSDEVFFNTDYEILYPSSMPSSTPTAAPSHAAEVHWSQTVWDGRRRTRQHGAGVCENGCSGHGTCDFLTQRDCQCYTNLEGVPEWTGPDCSQRTCPKDFAWVGSVVGADDLHP